MTMEKHGKEGRDVNEDEDDVVCMKDVIEEEELLEANANAVLGDCDDKNCTYPLGYVTRQALYACNTCKKGGNTSGGVCLACSYACHEGHDLVELYTKRHFRCDCGNDMFPAMKCSLYEFKDKRNEENQYNQNFSAVYCTCHRPYPDVDDEIPDEMLQCVICEDWYHGRHLATVVPPDDDYEEMICSGCMGKHDWLWAYTIGQPQVVRLVDGETAEDIDPGDNHRDDQNDGHSDKVTNGSVATSAQTQRPGARESVDQEATGHCTLHDLKSREVTREKGASFWLDGWREKLCRCQKCIDLYTTQHVSFLIDAADSVKYYEDHGHVTRSSQSQMERGMVALQGMNRVALGEVLHGFNDLKDSLKDYLRKFADNQKVVREEDIREFFVEMEARKRQRIGNVPPSHCK